MSMTTGAVDIGALDVVPGLAPSAAALRVAVDLGLVAGHQDVVRILVAALVLVGQHDEPLLLVADRQDSAALDLLALAGLPEHPHLAQVPTFSICHHFTSFRNSSTRSGSGFRRRITTLDMRPLLFRLAGRGSSYMESPPWAIHARVY